MIADGALITDDEQPAWKSSRWIIAPHEF